MDIGEAIKNRKSVRNFSEKEPDWRDIIEAIDHARYAPMAGNLLSTKFILINDPSKIQQIAESCQQDFMKFSHYLVVVCSDKRKTLTAYEEKGQMYLHQQAGAAMENFLLKITDLGLSTCWVGYFVEDEIKKLVEAPENVDIEGIFPIGYEKKHSLQKRPAKTELDACMFFEKYGNKKMEG